MKIKESCELWKDVVGYEGLYMVSSNGRVICVGSDRAKRATVSANGSLIMSSKENKGYLSVTFTKNNKRTQIQLHRVIAQAFIPNPHNKPQVNHINGVKSDNSIENLEWVTPSENVKHSFKVLGRTIHNKNQTGIYGKAVICIETGIEYVNINEAAKHNNVSASCISNAIKGVQKTSANKTWRLK